MYGFDMILRINKDYFLNNINRLIFVMESCCFFFAVLTQFLMLFLRPPLHRVLFSNINIIVP